MTPKIVKMALVCAVITALFAAWMRAEAGRARALEDLSRMSGHNIGCGDELEESRRQLDLCSRYYDMCMSIADMPLLEHRPW